jgi:hypothetical protein
VFDSVGRDLDQEAARRQLIAAPLTFLAFGSAIGLYALSVAIRVWLWGVHALIELPTDEEMNAVELEDPTVEEEAPPPPPPPLASGVEEEEEEEEEDPPDADEPVEDVKPLDEKIDETMKNDAVAGSEKGVEGGEEGGHEEGVAGGVAGGVPGGTGTGVRTLHHLDVSKKKDVPLEYPQTAKDLNMGDIDCRVTIFIDEDGVPYNVAFPACPAVFHDSARKTILQWRYWPAKVDGRKTKAQFVLKIEYRMTD